MGHRPESENPKDKISQMLFNKMFISYSMLDIVVSIFGTFAMSCIRFRGKIVPSDRSYQVRLLKRITVII